MKSVFLEPFVFKLNHSKGSNSLFYRSLRTLGEFTSLQNALGLIMVMSLLSGLVPGISSLQAIEPEEMLDDPVLERKARDISAGLRCLVCQNQSIDDSDADLARDMRRLVREQLVAGKSQLEIEDFLVSRYGHFVLLQPRWSMQTLALWLSPLLLFLAGIWLVVRYFRRMRVNGLKY